MSNGAFKLVQLELEDCTQAIDLTQTAPIDRPFPWAEHPTKKVLEFYPLQSTPLNPAGIDLSPDNLLRNCTTPDDPASCLDPPLRPVFGALQGELLRILDSEVACPGDGNLDKVVNQLDLNGVDAFAGSGPSFFDFNRDGQTDATDRAIVVQNLETTCAK